MNGKDLGEVFTDSRNLVEAVRNYYRIKLQKKDEIIRALREENEEFEEIIEDLLIGKILSIKSRSLADMLKGLWPAPTSEYVSKQLQFKFEKDSRALSGNSKYSKVKRHGRSICKNKEKGGQE